MHTDCQRCQDSPILFVIDWPLYSSTSEQTMQVTYSLLTHISKLSLSELWKELPNTEASHIINTRLDSARMIAYFTPWCMIDITRLTDKMQVGQHVLFQCLSTKNAKPIGHHHSSSALGPTWTKEFSEMSHFQRWVIIPRSDKWCLYP